MQKPFVYGIEGLKRGKKQGGLSGFRFEEFIYIGRSRYTISFCRTQSPTGGGEDAECACTMPMIVPITCFELCLGGGYGDYE
jgi:hypothetical protein